MIVDFSQVEVSNKQQEIIHRLDKKNDELTKEVQANK